MKRSLKKIVDFGGGYRRVRVVKSSSSDEPHKILVAPLPWHALDIG